MKGRIEMLIEEIKSILQETEKYVDTTDLQNQLEALRLKHVQNKEAYMEQIIREELEAFYQATGKY